MQRLAEKQIADAGTKESVLCLTTTRRLVDWRRTGGPRGRRTENALVGGMVGLEMSEEEMRLYACARLGRPLGATAAMSCTVYLWEWWNPIARVCIWHISGSFIMTASSVS